MTLASALATLRAVPGVRVTYLPGAIVVSAAPTVPGYLVAGVGRLMQAVGATRYGDRDAPRWALATSAAEAAEEVV